MGGQPLESKATILVDPKVVTWESFSDRCSFYRTSLEPVTSISTDHEDAPQSLLGSPPKLQLAAHACSDCRLSPRSAVTPPLLLAAGKQHLPVALATPTSARGQQQRGSITTTTQSHRDQVCSVSASSSARFPQQPRALAAAQPSNGGHGRAASKTKPLGNSSTKAAANKSLGGGPKIPPNNSVSFQSNASEEKDGTEASVAGSSTSRAKGTSGTSTVAEPKVSSSKPVVVLLKKRPLINTKPLLASAVEEETACKTTITVTPATPSTTDSSTFTLPVATSTSAATTSSSTLSPATPTPRPTSLNTQSWPSRRALGSAGFARRDRPAPHAHARGRASAGKAHDAAATKSPVTLEYVVYTCGQEQGESNLHLLQSTRVTEDKRRKLGNGGKALVLFVSCTVSQMNKTK